MAWMSPTVMLPTDAARTTIRAGTAPARGIGDSGVGLQHLDSVQPSRLRAPPGDGDVAPVQLDQPGAHVVTARMPGQDADHVPALAGTQADQPNVPCGGMIELSAQVPLHQFQPPREERLGIVVVARCDSTQSAPLHPASLRPPIHCAHVSLHDADPLAF